MPRKVARRDSTRGFVQEVIVGSGDAIAEVPARTSALEQEGNLLQLQDSSGKNRVEGGKKESREEEQRKEREKKEEDLKDRNDRRMEAMPALPNLPEQRGADRDEREREKADKEKEKDKVREKDGGRDEGKGTHREKRDKIDKERERELNHQRGHLDKEDRDEKEEVREFHNILLDIKSGIAGKSESLALLYRIGEGVPELAKLWKHYGPNVATGATKDNISSQAGLTVEIHIPADLATTSNHQIRRRQLWGTDVYTDDSDIVAVLMHTGYYTPTATLPLHPASELHATIRIIPPQEMYTSMPRNSLRSRSWGGGSGCSYRVERCQIIKEGGGSIELKPCLTHTPAVAATLSPAASEWTVSTRAGCSNTYLQQQLTCEVTIQYSLCNEPWLKYSMSVVADRGLKKSQYTSARLKKGDVLYAETHRDRYELAYLGNGATCNGTVSLTTATSMSPQPAVTLEKTKEKVSSKERVEGKGSGACNGEKPNPDNYPQNGEKSCQGHCSKPPVGDSYERYRWSRCKQPLPLSSMHIKGVPSPPDNVEVLQDGLAWEEVQWSPTSVWVRGTEYLLTRAQFISPHRGLG
ncbi:unnamed protein product [Sphagnum jensenii]|uniref:Histone deacetylation protein Rxt3 n=1 Tax=Sphagnum jensenii TaxID=128206 RepID=A0ABP0VPF8_9BRYO